MLKRMTHPQHGSMHVYSVSEMEANLKTGWVLDEEYAAPAIDAPEVKENIGMADDLVTQYIAKFGKPPHHRCSDETIRKALEE